MGWLWGDAACQFVGWEKLKRGDLNYTDAAPWASSGADVAPVVGDIKGVVEVFTGYDIITGEDLGWWRYAGLIPIAGPRLRKLRMVRTFANIAWLSKYGDTTSNFIRKVAFSAGLRGEELASQGLLDAVVRKGRQIFQDPETQRLLDYFKANASTDGVNISLRLDPRKIEVLEEFLHGTQKRLGIMDRLTTPQYERHVKSFMIRHKRLLGISDADVQWLLKSLEMYQ